MQKIQAAVSVVTGLIVAVALSRLISPDIALFAGFILIIGGLIYSDRDQVKLEGVMIIRRTKKGRDFIDRIASASKGFWRLAGNLGVVLGLIMMIFGSVMLATQAAAIIAGAEDGGVKLLLPGPVSTPVSGPGIFVVPWWIWVIGIAVVIIPHEFMHGVMCRIDKVRIKSVGWILLAVIPGAFVEPDEPQLKRQKKATKLRVYAAGSFANIATAILIVIVFIVFLSPQIAPAGVLVAASEGGPAYNASLNGSIIDINGNPVKTRDDITAILSGLKPGDAVEVTTAETKYAVPAFSSADALSPKPVALVNLSNTQKYAFTLAENPEGKAYMGVAVVSQAATLGMDLNTFSTLSVLLLWMFIFSFGIGIVNMLPIGPLDGGQFFRELAGGNKKVARFVSAAFIALLLFNLAGPLLL